MGESKVIAASAALSAFSVQRSAAHLNMTGSCGSIFRSRSGEQVDFTAATSSILNSTMPRSTDEQLR